MSRIPILLLGASAAALLALSCGSDSVNNAGQDVEVNIPWVEVCVLKEPCSGSEPESLGCRSSADTVAWDEPIVVVTPDTLCLRVAFAPGQHADSVTRRAPGPASMLTGGLSPTRSGCVTAL